MGILAQVAGGVGVGMVDNVEDRREDATNEADRNHRETLQRMRDLAMDNRQEDSQAHDMDKNKVARADAAIDTDSTRAYDKEIDTRDRERELVDTEKGHQNALELQRLKTSGAISIAEAKEDADNWQAITTKVISGYDQLGGAVYEEKEITFNKREGRYYEALGGELLRYDLTQHLDESERMLATDPSQAMNWAQAKGGPESLPAWFKTKHENVYQALKRDYQKTEDVGGGNKEGGALSQGAAARDSIDPIEISPARQPEGSYNPWRDSAGSGFRDVKDLIQEKPWIKGGVSRQRMGLSLTPEQEKEVAAFFASRATQ